MLARYIELLLNGHRKNSTSLTSPPPHAPFDHGAPCVKYRIWKIEFLEKKINLFVSHWYALSLLDFYVKLKKVLIKEQKNNKLSQKTFD